MPYELQPAGSHYVNGAYVEDTAGAEIPNSPPNLVSDGRACSPIWRHTVRASPT